MLKVNDSPFVWTIRIVQNQRGDVGHFDSVILEALARARVMNKLKPAVAPNYFEVWELPPPKGVTNDGSLIWAHRNAERMRALGISAEAVLENKE